MLKHVALIATAAVTMAACSPGNNSQSSPSPSPAAMREESSQSAGSAAQPPGQGVMVGGAMMTPDKNIVENAMNSKDHTTVVAAVTAAGLAETLQGPGPFTVFAPTNAAFDKLPAGTVEMLVKPENKQKLTGILTYHVVPGALTSADLTNGQTLTTVQGEMLKITERNGKWYINDTAEITIADVVSSNGVTHVIDTVLMPQ